LTLLLQRINLCAPSPPRGIFFPCSARPITPRGDRKVFRASLRPTTLFALTHAKSVRWRQQRHKRKLNEVHSAPV
jgi:hypothetical protein